MTTVKDSYEYNRTREAPIAASTAIPSYGSAAPETVTFDESTPTAVAVMSNEADALLPGEGGYEKDVSPEPVFRDVWYAVVFLAQIGFMLWLGIFVAPKGYATIAVNFTAIENEIRKESDDVTEEDLQQFSELTKEAAEYAELYPLRIAVYLIIPSAFLAFFFAYLSTAYFVRPCPKPMVQACLIGSVVMTALLMLSAAISSGEVFVYILTAISIGAVGYWVSIAWRLVPFAAVNLKVALEGISHNCGMYLVACAFAELGFGWILFWFYTLIGTFAFQNHKCMKAHPNENFDVTSNDYSDVCEPPFLVVVFFLISLYWTGRVIENSVQVTVAGVMATWCFAKDEADHCCSSAVTSSVYRSLTYSFGSICMGSLLQALISTLRCLLNYARAQRDQQDQGNSCGALLLCILECLASCLEDVIDYFNQWAYVYVGIYGFSYLDSGRRVVELFQARGWTSIITNNLVSYVCTFLAFAVAIITGLTAILVERLVSQQYNNSEVEFDSYIFGPVPAVKIWTFTIGFITGLWVASVINSVVKGAVNTLIVCWADSPAVLDMNHPVLTKEMAEAWRSVFPDVHILVQPVASAVVV